jgi:hypothetical protein
MSLQAKLKVTGISVALRMLLTDKVHSIASMTSLCRHSSLTHIQRDIRLERNDIIALINTLQQVRRRHRYSFWDVVCKAVVLFFIMELCSFPKRFGSATGFLQ